jgi:DNA-binding SARP family transcriptional activator
MALRIHIVGDVAVEGDLGLVGQDELHGPQGRLVLAMLAGEHRRAVRRDELADALWGDRLPAAWETAVRVLVSKLRAAIERVEASPRHLIDASAGAYRLRLPADGWIDLDEAASAVHRAEDALRREAPEAAGPDALVASMIAGRGFLPGIDGPWVEAMREKLLDIHIRALVCLAEVWFARGDYEQAARDAEAVVRIDPYRESAHRLLMRSHVAAGDRASAARAYATCCRLLTEDLGVRPSRRTTDLATVLGLSAGSDAAPPAPHARRRSFGS